MTKNNEPEDWCRSPISHRISILRVKSGDVEQGSLLGRWNEHRALDDDQGGQDQVFVERHDPIR